MTNRQPVIILLVSAILSAAILVYGFTHRKTGNVRVSWNVHQGLHGWGYDVLVNDSLFIRQEAVPGITGPGGFAKKEQAEEAAKLIVHKLERRERPVFTSDDQRLIFNSAVPEHEWPGKTE